MSIDSAQNYQTQTAVLFIIFNRPDTTAKVFEQIKKARPKKLYIAADGPRADRPNEELICNQTRETATAVDWDCRVETLFNTQNKGCKMAVSSAITWFFNKEEEGIIIEDDCLPADDFFRFCDELLEKYRYDTRIRHIAGGNFQQGLKRGEASYYFSKISHVWGWASWRRAWADYDVTLNKYNEEDGKAALCNVFDDKWIAESWCQIFTEMKKGGVDTWDYQWGFTNYFNNALCIIPNVNLISNIGFGENATHTTQTDNIYANVPHGRLNEITHPQFFVADKTADEFSLSVDFNIAEKKRQYNKPRRKLKRWLKSVIGKNSL